MSAPLGREQPERAGPRPTEHQLRMARIRAGVTGESLSHVLAVFMGVGRYGEQAGATATGPEAPLGRGQLGPSGPPGPAGPADRDDRADGAEDGDGADGCDGTPRLARVIPLSARAHGGPPGAN